MKIKAFFLQILNNLHSTVDIVTRVLQVDANKDPLGDVNSKIYELCTR